MDVINNNNNNNLICIAPVCAKKTSVAQTASGDMHGSGCKLNNDDDDNYAL